MPKPYYADYVNHMLRYYATYRDSKGIRSDVDERNYRCVDKVINTIPQYEQLILMDIYRRRDALPDNVCRVSAQSSIDPRLIWTLISGITNKIARERHLI